MREERADTIRMDELWASLDGQSDEEKASTYLGIVEVLMEHERYASALPLIDIAIELELSHHGDKKHPHVGEAIIAKAFCMWHMGEIEWAVDFLEEGLEIQSMLPPFLLVDRLQTLASWSYRLGRVGDLLRTKEHIVELFQGPEDSFSLAIHVQNLAITYFEIGRFADAYSCAIRSDDFFKEISQVVMRARSEMLLGACLAEIGETAEGLKKTTHGLRLLERGEDENYRDARALYFQGLALLRSGQFEGARDFLLEARNQIVHDPDLHEIEIKIAIEKELAAAYALLDEIQDSEEINERLQLVENYFADIFS